VLNTNFIFRKDTTLVTGHCATLETWSSYEGVLIGKKYSPIEIHHPLMQVYNNDIMRWQHDCKWCTEFANG
jgi:hypothetical protein